MKATATKSRSTNELSAMKWHPGVFTSNREDGFSCRSWPIYRSGSAVVGYGSTREESISDAARLAMEQERLRANGEV